MPKKSVLIVSGGGGPEHDISLVSAKFLQNVLSDKFHILPLEIPSLGHFYNSWPGLGKVDFVIPCLHGRPGESGEIQTILEAVGVPYLGSGPEAGLLCFNKVATKLILQAHGHPGAPFVFGAHGEGRQKIQEFFQTQGRAFIKGSHQGSSIGCSLVEELAHLDAAVNLALELSPWALAEEVIEGRELEVAVYQHKGQLKATPPGEIIPPKGKFYDYEQKYSPQGQTQIQLRANLPGPIQSQIAQKARDIFRILMLRDLARMDFFLTHKGEILISEVNTFPGMTPISLFPKMLEANGDSLAQFLEQIIEARAPV